MSLAQRRDREQVRTEQVKRSLVCHNVPPHGYQVRFLLAVVVADSDTGIDDPVTPSNHLHDFVEYNVRYARHLAETLELFLDVFINLAT